MPRIPLTRDQCVLAVRAIEAYLGRRQDKLAELEVILARLNKGVNVRVKKCGQCDGEMEFVDDAFRIDAGAEPRRPGQPYERLQFESAWICNENPRHYGLSRRGMTG